MAVDWAETNILLIDDEPFMRTLIGNLLREVGAKRVYVADDGAEGFKKASLMGSALDLVIVDLEMPRLDGCGFITLMREAEPPVRRDVPIVVLSGHREAAAIKSAVRLGIHGYMTKPISITDLDKRLSSALTGPMIDKRKADQM